MRTSLEFRSCELSDPARDEDVPRGETLARFLGAELPKHGFAVADIFAEDWGWQVTIDHEPFPLWVGCGHYQEWPDGLLCFISPRKPYVRRWLKRVPTTETIERLATAIETVIRDSDKAYDLLWWTVEENARG